MTRPHSAELADVVTGGSFTREVVADVFYGATRTLTNVPLQEWTLTGDYDGKIKTAASCKIVYQGDLAESVSPRYLTDALAPFGQEIRLYMQISAGAFTERVPLGVYRIDDVPSARDETIPLQGRTLTVGSVVELTLLDRFDAVDRALFRTLEMPASLASAWAEIARVSRQQVTRTVADVAIPNSVVYARNRLDTVQQLAGLLGGRAVMLSDGTLGVIPDTLGSPTVALYTGEEQGTIIEAGYYLSSTDIANVVIGDFEDDNGNPIHEEAFIAEGPLGVQAFGERVVEYPGDQKEFIKTREAARTAVANYLAKVSTLGQVEIPVSLTPDPRIEIGDVVTLQRPDRTITGRVVKYSHSRTGSMSITVRAPANG